MKHGNCEIQVFFNSQPLLVNQQPNRAWTDWGIRCYLINSEIKVVQPSYNQSIDHKHDTLMMCWPHLRKGGQTCGEKMYWWWREEIPCYRSHFGPNIPTPEHLRLRRRKLSCNDLKNTWICKKKREVVTWSWWRRITRRCEGGNEAGKHLLWLQNMKLAEPF